MADSRLVSQGMRPGIRRACQLEPHLGTWAYGVRALPMPAAARPVEATPFRGRAAVGVRKGRATLPLAVLLVSLGAGCASVEPDHPVEPQLLLLEDPEGSLTIEQIASGHASSEFREIEPNRGYTDSVYWGRLTLDLEGLTDDRLVLVVGSPRTDDIRLYLPEPDGRLVEKVAGDAHAMSERDIGYRSPAFLLRPGALGLQPQLFVRIQTLDAMQLTTTLYTEASFNRMVQAELLVFGLYYGCALSLIAYNLFLLFAVSDRNYLYYVLYVLSFALYQASAHGLSFFLLWGDATWFASRAPQLFGLSTLFMFAVFTRTFLHAEEYAPRMCHLLKVFQWLALPVAALVMFAWSNAVIRLTTLVLILGALSLIATGVRTWWRGYKPARLFVAAWSFFLWGVVLAGLKQFGVLPVTVVTEYGMQIGSVMELLLLSLALADRINLLKAERAEAQREALALQRQATATLQTAVESQTLELRRQKEDLEAANRKLAQLDLVKTRFFQNISHDLRTPLQMIIGPVKDAIDGEMGRLSWRVETELRTVLRHANHLLRLVSQLLDLSRLDAARMRLRVRHGDLSRFVREISGVFGSWAERKRVLLQVSVEPDRLPAYFDPEVLEKVLNNLLSNAIKWTEAGGKVGVSLCADDELAELRVWDTGCGIEEADLPRVFSRFWSRNPDRGDGSNSTGIGLSLVKELVELHCGEIAVESRMGMGSQFAVRVPYRIDQYPDVTRDPDAGIPDAEPATSMALEPMPDPEASVNTNESVQTARHSLIRVAERVPPTRHIVVVAEDNADVRRYLKGLLTPIAEMREAQDGREAIELLESVSPSLISRT